MKTRTLSPSGGLDLTAVDVAGRSFCGHFHSDVPMDYCLSGNHEPTISAVLSWWEKVLSGMGNHADDNSAFIKRLSQLVDEDLETDARFPALIHLGKTGCGHCYCGMIKDVCEAVLTPAVANVMYLKERGQEPATAKRAFYLPAAFADDDTCAMYADDLAVLIVKWNRETGFQVKEVVWVKEGVSIPLIVAMQYWKDQADSLTGRSFYGTPQKRFTAIANFCETLFKAVGLPVDCVAAEVPSTTIGVEYANRAVEEANLKLDNDFPSNIMMMISSDGVEVTIKGKSFWVWKKD